MLNFLRCLFAAFVLALPFGVNAEIPDDPNQVRPLLPGMVAPVFNVQRADGGEYGFDPGRLEKPMVLVFYRGGWCPYCNLHLAQLREAEAELIELGYEVLFISPDRPEKLYSSLQEEDIDYQLLSDSKMEAAKAFGVAFRLDGETLQKYAEYGIDLEAASGEDHHMLPAPAVFVISKDGVIRFQYVNPNYKARLHPDVLLAAARVALEGR